MQRARRRKKRGRGRRRRRRRGGWRDKEEGEGEEEGEREEGGEQGGGGRGRKRGRERRGGSRGRGGGGGRGGRSRSRRSSSALLPLDITHLHRPPRFPARVDGSGVRERVGPVASVSSGSHAVQHLHSLLPLSHPTESADRDAGAHKNKTENRKCWNRIRQVRGEG